MKIRIEQEPTRWDSLSMRDRAKYIHQSIQNHYANGGSMTDISIDDIRHQFEEGWQQVPSFNEWIKALAHAWDTTPEQVLDPKQYYDYVKYYEDNPQEAWNQIALFNLQRQRELTEEEKQKLHFPDSGESGTYKTLNHPTHPEMGYSWNENNTVFYPSERQFYMNNPKIPNETNTDRILDYLGSDLNYNKGASKAVYDKGIILPTTYITPRESYQVLERNPLDTGWQYKQEEYDNGGTLIHQYDEGGTTWMKPGQGYNFFQKLFKTKTYKNAINGNNASSVQETPSIQEQPQTAQQNTAPTYDNSRFYQDINLSNPDFIEKTLPQIKNDLKPFVEDYFTRLQKYHPDIDINKGWEIFNNMPFNIENGLESEHVSQVNGMYGKGAYATGSYHSPSKSMTYYHYGDDPRSITQYGNFLNSVAHEYSHAFRDQLLGGVNEMSKEEQEILDRALPRLNVISPLRNAEGSATISQFRNHLGTKYGVYGQIFNDYLNGLSDSDLLDLFSDENAYVKGITPEYLASIDIDPEEYELAEMTWKALNARIRKNIEAGIQTDQRVQDAWDRALDYLNELDAIKSGNYPNYDKSKINALRQALELIAENNSSKSNTVPQSFIAANGGTLIHQYDGTSEDTQQMNDATRMAQPEYIPQLGEYKVKSNIIEETRRRLAKNIDPTMDYKYSIPAVWHALVSNKDTHGMYQDPVDMSNITGDPGYNQAIWETYLGQPASTQYIEFNPDTKPINAGDELYYRLKLNEEAKQKLVQAGLQTPRGKFEPSTVLGGFGMNNHAIGRNVDPQRGEFVSYKDVYDLNPFHGDRQIMNIPGLSDIDDLSLGIGTPVNLYDRVYLDDLYGVSSLPTDGDYYGGYIPEITILPNKKKKH